MFTGLFSGLLFETLPNFFSSDSNINKYDYRFEKQSKYNFEIQTNKLQRNFFV